MYSALACFAALLFVYSLISEKVERVSLSGPIVFVAVTILTVGISLVVHGVAARPFASRLAGRSETEFCANQASGGAVLS